MKLRLLAALFACVSLGRAAPPEVKATATSPEAPARLAAHEALYVRIAYQSDQPLRFQAAGYFHGTKKANFMMNPSPVYPAGRGEAVAWLSADAGARIDEMRVLVQDASWKALGEVPLPVQAAWHAGIPANAPADWARELSKAQQRLLSQDLQQLGKGTGTPWDRFVDAALPFLFLSVPFYPLVQAWALYRQRGARRLLAAVPLAFMLPTYAFCLYALSQDSNLWPLPAIFLSPVAALLVIGMLIYFHFRPVTPKPATSHE